MILTPDKIYQEYSTKSLDKTTAINLLISIIENSEEEHLVLDSLLNLKKIGDFNDKIFFLIENLMVSDSNEKIRCKAAELIQKYYLDKALEPMKWAVENEKDYKCLTIVINTLEIINNDESKNILINELKKIKKRRYIDNSKQYTNKIYRKDLKDLFRHKKIQNLTSKKVAEILLNYKTIENLIKKFLVVYYKTQNGLITSLDLSELGWNVNVWKQPYSERIENLNQIPGLLNLRMLKSLDLSNNRIKNIELLIYLRNLTDLKIANNKLEDFKNLNYIKEMNNLKYLDIRRNKIITKLDTKDFKKDLKILIKDELYFQ